MRLLFLTEGGGSLLAASERKLSSCVGSFGWVAPAISRESRQLTPLPDFARLAVLRWFAVLTCCDD
ncbi:MAG: hypothetical protein U1A77_01845 [Pirellulales bacterium]